MLNITLTREEQENYECLRAAQLGLATHESTVQTSKPMDIEYSWVFGEELQ